jgi:hypothetical protein
MSTKLDEAKSRGFFVVDEIKDKKFWLDYLKQKKTVSTLVIAKSKLPNYPGWLAFIYFTNPHLLKSVKSYFPKRVVGICAIKPKHAYDNVMCGVMLDDDRKTGSTVIYDLNGRPSGQGARTDIEEVVEAIKKGEITTEKELLDFNKPLFFKYKKTLLEVLDMYTPRRILKSEVYNYHGEGNAGKSHEVQKREYNLQKDKLPPGLTFEQFVQEEYVNIVSLSGDGGCPFVHNYKRGEAVLFDEFDYRQVESSWWLRICDRWPCTINIKNGGMNWAPLRIYFTSNISAEFWWGGWSFPIKRRFIKEGTKLLNVIKVTVLNPDVDEDDYEQQVLEKETKTSEGIIKTEKCEKTVKTEVTEKCKKNFKKKDDKEQVNIHSKASQLLRNPTAKQMAEYEESLKNQPRSLQEEVDILDENSE